MKLVINYDFFKAVRNVNESLTPMKIVRNEYKYAIYTSLWVPTSCLLGNNVAETIKPMLVVHGIYMVMDLMRLSLYKKLYGEEKYKFEASEKLKRLPAQLDSINIKTNYEMLLNSELYERRFKIESNENGIIPVKEEKFIYVPSYGFDGKEKETSIMQEHNIGSNIYILSVAEPEKRYRRVLVNNNA